MRSYAASVGTLKAGVCTSHYWSTSAERWNVASFSAGRLNHIHPTGGLNDKSPAYRFLVALASDAASCKLIIDKNVMFLAFVR